MLAVQLVAAVHRARRVPLVLADRAHPGLGRRIGQTIRGDGRGIQEADAAAVRLAFPLRELEQGQRAIDVHVMRGDRRELRSRREQRREMEDEIDLELREHALEQVGVGNRAGELAMHQPVQVGVERRQIDRDDRTARAGQPRDQPVADLTAGAGHERDWCPHSWTVSTGRVPRTTSLERGFPAAKRAAGVNWEGRTTKAPTPPSGVRSLRERPRDPRASAQPHRSSCAGRWLEARRRGRPRPPGPGSSWRTPRRSRPSARALRGPCGSCWRSCGVMPTR